MTNFELKTPTNAPKSQPPIGSKQGRWIVAHSCEDFWDLEDCWFLWVSDETHSEMLEYSDPKWWRFDVFALPETEREALIELLQKTRRRTGTP